MPCVMQFADGRCETLLDGRDFEYYVRQYMGDEAGDYFLGLFTAVEEAEAENEELLEGQKIFEKRIDELEEDKKRFMDALLDEVAELLDMLSDCHLDRDGLHTAASGIYEMVTDGDYKRRKRGKRR
ncbi:MAG: hypothetical protein BACD_00171 [Bacteroides rodentium]